MFRKVKNIAKLKKLAKRVRRDILIMLERAGSGHTGGSLSSVEILVALYFYKMRHDPKRPDWDKRDRFILSKGHSCPALYAVLAQAGYFPKEELLTLRKLGSRLQGHPQIGLPGLEISSGSLGQGLSIANGMALASKLDGLNNRIYCLLGDGETHEGQVWEAAMSASHYRLDNLCATVDYNRYCIDGPIEEVKALEPLLKKWKAFGWQTIAVDGHDFKQLFKAFDEAETVKGKPSIVIANTIKGKGVSFIENDNRWHGIAPKKEDLERALKELE